MLDFLTCLFTDCVMRVTLIPPATSQSLTTSTLSSGGAKKSMTSSVVIRLPKFADWGLDLSISRLWPSSRFTCRSPIRTGRIIDFATVDFFSQVRDQ